ncbi:RNA 2',3'-cyclic phosphodiesterase [Sunxiuqinia sp. A32]|uniref:RNA 2',3'-cyclic phosphodiesterase n=1 Tax=Sunxiuqinia sp. A32 TaxID=3461496 RepID=UPI004045B13C
MKRLFIGIKIELEAVLKQVADVLKRQLKNERIKWVPDENLHITLHFLGNTSAVQLQKVVELMHMEISRKNSFSFRLGEVAYFKRHAMPSALFFSLYDADELIELAGNLKDGLKDLGFNVGNTFKPHLTLGRVKNLKDKRNFYETVHALQNDTQQVVQVEKVILFESVLNPAGPIYKPLEIIYLEG